MNKIAIIIGIMMMALAPIAGNIMLGNNIAHASIKKQIESGADKVGGGDAMEVGDLITNVTNVLLFLIGALSVIFIIISGIYYVTSQGNAEQVKKAKNTMVYAVVGLIISILAYAIVNFVIGIF